MGEIFAFLSAIGFALANVMIKKGTTKGSKNNGAFVSILLTALMSGIFFIIVGLSKGWTVLNGEGIFWFVIAGFLTAFVGRNFLYSAIQHLGSVRASALKRLNPFFTVILGVVLLNEVVNGTLFIGMALIFCSFGILIYESNRASAPKGEALELHCSD
jgi:drug/metabolite transporter (DMT)-like permease